MANETISDLLRAMNSGLKEVDLDPDVQRTYLKEMRDKMAEPRDFEVGDFVEWKPGLRFKEVDGVMLATKILDEAIIANRDAGTPYFHEPLDTLILIIGPAEHDILEYHFDSRRLQKVTL